MSTTRTVSSVYSATNEKVGEFSIKNVLPHRQLKQVDPFILIHHMGPLELAPGSQARIPPHPHAGFEVVTYLLDGSFFHRDSKGHDQVAGPGDVNWMTAAAGIVHSEGPSEAMLEKGGRVQLLQVWINLPARLKKEPAGFRHYPANAFPVTEPDGIRVKTLLGTFNGKSSPIEPATPMFWHHINIPAGKHLMVPVKHDHTAALYVMNGNLQVLDSRAAKGDLLHFSQDGDQLSIRATENTELMLFGGLPLGEKLVSYGPFVMNSLEEVQVAIREYETGKMGALDR